MKTVAIVQARLGSTRLPLKSLLCLRGMPIIDWVVARVRTARLLDEVVVACPDTALDQVLISHLEAGGVPVFAGSENDVLDRFVAAARRWDAGRIVRVCADNPLVWGEAIDRLIRFHESGHADYSYNHVPRENLWPDGLGAEIVDRDLLEYMAAVATAPAQREHCMNYLWDNRERFTLATFDPGEVWLRRPDIRLDVDTVEDFRRLSLLPLSVTSDARRIVTVVDNFGI